MLRFRSGTAKLLALILPASLVWVFFACTIQCMAAAGPGCLEHELGDSCCAAEAEAPCEAEELSNAHEGCGLVVERGVLAANGQRQRADLLDATPAAFFGLAVVAPASEPRCSAPLAHGPPRPRPLDRLPTLLI
jgi:hypothetical protein